MDKQPVALRLADALDQDQMPMGWYLDAAAELRRLHAINSDLMEALNAKRQWVGLTEAEINEWDYDTRDLVMDIEKLLREKNT